MAFIISYLLALRDDINSGKKSRGKFINSLILSFIALPFAIATKEILLILFHYHSENIPMLIGFFCWVLGCR